MLCCLSGQCNIQRSTNNQFHIVSVRSPEGGKPTLFFGHLRACPWHGDPVVVELIHNLMNHISLACMEEYGYWW